MATKVFTLIKRPSPRLGGTRPRSLATEAVLATIRTERAVRFKTAEEARQVRIVVAGILSRTAPHLIARKNDTAVWIEPRSPKGHGPHD